MGHFEMVLLVAPLQRKRILANDSFLKVKFRWLICQSTVIRGNQQPAEPVKGFCLSASNAAKAASLFSEATFGSSTTRAPLTLNLRRHL